MTAPRPPARRSPRQVDPGPAGAGRAGGYTLIEMLVVMIIIGILAAIAIPVLLAQRGKAHDTATRRDLAEVGKAVVAAFVASGGAPTVQLSDRRYLVNGEEVGPASGGVVIGGGDPTAVDTTGWTLNAWCMTFTDPAGSTKDYRYSAQAGLEPGSCSSTTAP